MRTVIVSLLIVGTFLGFYMYSINSEVSARKKNIEDIRNLVKKISKEQHDKVLKRQLIGYLDEKYTSRDGRPTVRGIAAASVGKLVRQWKVDMSLAIPELMKIVENDNDFQEQRNAIFALGTLGDKSAAAIPYMKKLMNSDELLMRIEAVEGLAGMGKSAESAVPELLKLLDEYYPATEGDDGPQIRNYAAKALGNIGLVSDDVVMKLKNGMAKGTYSFKIQCAVALIKLDQKFYKEAMEVLKGINENGKNSYQRSKAYGALKEVKDLNGQSTSSNKDAQKPAPNTPKK